MLTWREPLELKTGAAASASLIAGRAVNAASLLEQRSHRLWPLPKTAWFLFMRWHDLLFLHWPVRPETIRPLIPRVLELDTFDGWCWIGVVPFRMTGVRPHYFPIPLAFPELNVRTYVKTPRKTGVWFFSLDAANWLAVRAARWLGMPYYDARMTVGSAGESVDYKSLRDHKKAAAAEFDATYAPTGGTYMAQPGTLDHWLTERYCLFSALNPDRIVFGEIHHPQWRLQPATVELRSCTMLQASGIELSNSQPLCHFSLLQEVVAWPIVPIEHAEI
jgi:uncharacterized protein